jgi:ParB family chromosome partitioning protein
MAIAAAVFPEDAKAPAAVQRLAEAVAADGGAALAIYREPIGGHWQIFAMIPPAVLKPTPFQRDLSPTHMKRLVEVMKKLDRYTEPVVAVRAGEGEYWTPNGNHRRAAAVKASAEMIPAVLVPEIDVAYQILALNTEKTHNLRDKALEVIRMFRGRLEQSPGSTEKSFAFEFERPHFITLGLVYERKPRFSGGVYVPIVSRVDNFLTEKLGAALEEHEERAAQIEHADEILNALVARGKKRGLTHPYLKNFIVARCNPLTRARKTLPSYKAALNLLTKSLGEFDLGRIHFGQLQSAAAIAAAAGVAAS